MAWQNNNISNKQEQKHQTKLIREKPSKTEIQSEEEMLT